MNHFLFSHTRLKEIEDERSFETFCFMHLVYDIVVSVGCIGCISLRKNVFGGFSVVFIIVTAGPWGKTGRGDDLHRDLQTDTKEIADGHVHVTETAIEIGIAIEIEIGKGTGKGTGKGIEIGTVTENAKGIETAIVTGIETGTVDAVLDQENEGIEVIGAIEDGQDPGQGRQGEAVEMG